MGCGGAVGTDTGWGGLPRCGKPQVSVTGLAAGTQNRALVAVGMLAKPQNGCGEDGSEFFSNRVLRGGVATKR